MRHQILKPRFYSLVLGLSFFVAPLAYSQVVYEGTAGPGKGKHIVLLAGDHEYRSEETIPALARILAKHHGFKCSVVFSVDKTTGEIDPASNHMPGIEALDTADLAVFSLRFRDLPAEQMKHVTAYMDRGGPVMGLRTSTHAFKIKADSPFAKYSWDYKGADYTAGWGHLVLGQSWVGHYGKNHQQSTRITAVQAQAAHPILRGVKDIWVQAGGYVGKPVDGTILTMAQPLDGMKQDSPANATMPPQPSEWTRTYKSASGKEGRVFTSLYGASEDLLNPGYRRMLVNAAFWSAGLEKAIKPDLAVDFVGPYTPNTFSSGGHVAGVKPTAYAGFESPIPAGKAEPKAKGKRKSEAAAKPEAKPAAEQKPADSKAEARKRRQGAKNDAPTDTSAAAKAMKEGNALEAKALTPEEQLKLFKVPEGFTIELVASEMTGVPKPVSLAFDDAGRLWTQTATEYPRDMDPAVWTKPGKDRVVVIDHPEKAELQPARTFADGMVMPMSVLPYRDGAFVAQGSEILFLADTDGDGRADTRKTLIKGFGVQDTHTLPHQLVRLPGGNIGFSQGVLNSGTLFDADGKPYPFNKTLIASFAPQGNGLRVMAAGMNNIWAWAQDRLGRVFIHEANDWGHSLTPFEEDSSYVSFIGTSIHPDVPMHPPTAPDLNLGGTGFSGIAVSDDRSGSFQGSWRDAFFVANPIIGKINHATGTQGADAVWAFKKGEDLVSCSDPMFRPVFVTFGPDGCLYIADWYNRIISHNEVARDHPGRDKDHGRIWRVRQTGQPSRAITDYTKMPTDQLPAALKSDSTWAMRAAWHQMAQRKDKSVVPALVDMLRDAQTPVDLKIAALWTLEEVAPFDADLWKQLLSDTSPDLRREAVRALITLKVPQAVAGPLLKQRLAGETAWTVRHQVLRYFRLADGPVADGDLAWLKEWSATPAKTTKMKGQKGGGGASGEFLALDGSYQRAFQDFLFMLAKTKTQLPVMAPAKYDGVLAKHSAPANPAAVAARIAAVKSVLPNAKAEDGRALTESLCLTCHSLGGKGVGFAPPLDGTWSRDVDGVLTAIVAPSAAMENVFRNFRVIRTDGTIVEGFKQNENRKSVTLLMMGGAPQSIPMKAIKSAGYIEGQSMMPDLTGGMTPEQVASIVAYLRSVK